MGIVVDSLEALITAYFVAIVLQLGLGYLISNLGRNALMQGDRMRPIYFALTSFAWLISAAVAAYVAFTLPPFGMVGSWAYTFISGFLLIYVILRNHKDAPHQQTMAVNVLFSLCILIGCLGGDLLRWKAISQ